MVQRWPWPGGQASMRYDFYSLSHSATVDGKRTYCWGFVRSLIIAYTMFWPRQSVRLFIPCLRRMHSSFLQSVLCEKTIYKLRNTASTCVWWPLTNDLLRPGSVSNLQGFFCYDTNGLNRHEVFIPFLWLVMWHRNQVKDHDLDFHRSFYL